MVDYKLIHLKADGNYCLWLKTLEYGQAAAENFDIGELALPYLESLMQEIEPLSVYYGLMDDSHAYYLKKLSNPAKRLDRKLGQAGRALAELSLHAGGDQLAEINGGQ